MPIGRSSASTECQAYVLRLADSYPLPVKFLRSLALIIVRQRSSVFQITDPGLKVRHWFAIIGREFADPAIVPENVYNMDETGVLLSVLNSLKVLVDKDDLRKHRGTTVKRTLVTAIESISADGQFLHPLKICPAATHRSSWTTHATPGWHFACPKTGYTNIEISLYWIKHVFDPQTRDRAGGRPRLLICDGFGTHESLEVMKFCFANRIILCCLPSHTSHKLQPCDVGVSYPLLLLFQ